MLWFLFHSDFRWFSRHQRGVFRRTKLVLQTAPTLLLSFGECRERECVVLSKSCVHLYFCRLLSVFYAGVLLCFSPLPNMEHFKVDRSKIAVMFALGSHHAHVSTMHVLRILFSFWMKNLTVYKGDHAKTSSVGPPSLISYFLANGKLFTLFYFKQTNSCLLKKSQNRVISFWIL